MKRSIDQQQEENNNQQQKKSKTTTKTISVILERKQIKLVLLDIEGTTTSISFVAETLFPWIRSHLESYLKETWNSEQTKKDVDALRLLNENDLKSNPTQPYSKIKDDDSNSIDDVRKSVVENVISQMDKDRKSTALKQLQGHMWKKGYENGELKGHLYQDAFEKIKEWNELGLIVCIYSSGSIEAQKLLFGFSQFGDLLPMLSAHFDTTIGLKTETQSYKNIFSELTKTLYVADCISSPSEILFVTDNPKEAIAATEANFSVIVTDRPGNASLSNEVLRKFRVVRSFHEI